MNADAEAVADNLSRWIASFTVMDIWVSDQGSHFKNKVIKEMAEGFEVTHHFTTAYTPWANGTVERCCREVLRATSALRSELRLGERDWPAVTNLVQRILNTAPLARLGKNRHGEVLSPVEVFTGQKPKRPISLALPVVDKDNLSVLSMEEKRAMQRVNISGLQAAIENIYKSTSERVTKRRIEEIKRHNQKTNIVPVSFEKGDFVLVRRAHKKGHKLSFKWVGPRRIVAIKSNWVYDVVDLVSGKQETAHTSRLTPYRADWEGTDVPEKLLSYAEHSEAMYQDLLEILDIKKVYNAYWLLASWEGMESELDTTWEPLQKLYEDVPKMVSEYLKSVQSSKKKIAEAATRRLGNNI